VCSENGADEALPFENTNIARFDANSLTTYQLPKASNGNIKELLGGDAVQNAKITLDILGGKIKGTPLETVVLNAALGIIASDRCGNIDDAKMIALESIESGKALQTLKRIIDISNKL
jgi:anthranilate phosphoribosyltransferase